MFDEVEFGVVKMYLIVLVLSLELLVEKDRNGLGRPAARGHFLAASAGVEHPQEIQVGSFHPSKGHRELHHERKLPCLVGTLGPGAK
ncbi:hypothetical protein D9M71_828780 [compost metagenome]